MAKDNPSVFGYIYLVRNSINGKIYIGKTTQSLKTRWAEHCAVSKNRGKSAFHNAIRKYGRDAFTLVELERAASEEELNDMERRSILGHDSTNRSIGYNLTKGGDGISSYVAPAHVRKKISESSKAMWARPGFRERMSAQRRHHYKNPAVLAAHTASVNEFCRGDKYKALHRSNSLAMWERPEYRAKHKQSILAVMSTPEYKAKQSLSSKQRWADPAFKAAQSAKRKELWSDPEYRARSLARRNKTKAKNKQQEVSLPLGR